MFEKFPYINLHELNLDWIINKLHEIESAAVLSVNGQTGDVVLYQDALVVFPPVTDNQWNIYRQVGNTGDTSIEGIQFIKGQPAQRIAGLQRYNIYDQGNPPPYPVTSVQGQTGDVVVTFPVSSVNGLTGDVVLYQNPVIQYPTTDQNTWNLYRIVTGSDSTTEAAGIQFIKGQAAQRIAGLQRYDIYDQGNPPPYPVTSVNGQTGAVVLTFPVTSVNGQTGDVTITIPVQSVNGQTGAVVIPPFVTDRTVALMDVDAVVSGATQWGLSRNIKLGSTVNTADVGILFDTETDGTLKAYIRKKIGNTVITEKILTPADIPSDTGVISVNGASGVVSLDGDDIPSTSGSALSVSDVLSGHTLDITDLQNQADAIEEDLADYYSASADYAVGDLVIRNDRLWKCNTAITGGEAWNASHWDQTTIADELGTLKSTLLWQNSSPSTFSAQTLTMNLSKYKFVVVVAPEYYGDATRYQMQNSVTIPVGYGGFIITFETMGLGADDALTMRVRRVNTNVNGITFSDAYNKDVGTVGNNYCVPIAIYGLN